MDRNHLNNFERGSTKDHSCEIWSKSNQWFRRRCCLKIVNGRTDGRRRRQRRRRRTDGEWSQYLTLSLRLRWAKKKLITISHLGTKLWPRLSRTWAAGLVLHSTTPIHCKTVEIYHILLPVIFFFFFFFFFFWFGFYGPFKNISLILSWSFIKGGWKQENPGKNHLTIRKQNLVFPHVIRARLEPLPVTRVKWIIQIWWFLSSLNSLGTDRPIWQQSHRCTRCFWLTSTASNYTSMEATYFATSVPAELWKILRL